jgi:hypothetical protein
MPVVFFEFSSSTMAGIIGYAGDLIGNAMPLIVVVVGVSIGLWILAHFIGGKKGD